MHDREEELLRLDVRIIICVLRPKDVAFNFFRHVGTRGDRPTDLQNKVEADDSRDVAQGSASVEIIDILHFVLSGKSFIQLKEKRKCIGS
jgi:hypothetical protein